MSTRFVLPPDVVLMPAARLDARLREQLRANEGDVAIDRPLARGLPKLIDADTAALLREFEQPHTLAEAIVALARARNANAAELVPAAHQALSRFIAGGILVEEGSRLASEISARLHPTDEFEGFRIRECVRTMADVELYLAADVSGQPVALKIWRDTTDHARDAARHEASILRAIDGTVAPRLIIDGSDAAPPYIAMQWCRGVDPEVAADEDDALPASERLRRRWARACAIADAYVRLHALGIVHGDVHEGNVLIDRDGSITLLDFGLARLQGGESPGRGAVFPYLEPEYAQSELTGSPEPATSEAGEQYVLAALCFRIISGAHYLDLSPVRADAVRQIAEMPARSFSSCGCIPWPTLEAVLQRALEKEAADRFPSLRAFSEALQAAVPSEALVASNGHTNGKARGRRPKGVSSVWTLLGATGPRFDSGYTTSPTCSITYGAAGAALAWYRRSLLTESADDLRHARQWMRLTEAQRRDAKAFSDGDELTRSSIGALSLHHGSLGVWLTAALVAHASGDEAGAAEAVRRWRGPASSSRHDRDLTLGRAGVVLSAALLAEVLGPTGWVGLATVHRVGARAERALWDSLDSLGPINQQVEVPNLGIAHGWAGMLYATLCWRAVAAPDAERDARLRQRLDELAACAEPSGRGVRWPWRDEPPGPGAFQSYAAGWCNGSAGFVHVWLAAFTAFGEPRYLELANGAAWHAWEFGDDEVESLCCGMAGRAYALLAMFRATGEERWWSWARELVRHAAAAAHLDHPEALSLYRGALGVALLLEELEQPNVARMPAFESDGWVLRA